MSLPPISIFDAGGFALFMVVIISAVGEALQEIVGSFLKVRELHLDVSRRAIVDFAAGSALIALLGMIFTYFGIPFRFLAFLPVAAAAVIVVRFIVSVRSYCTRFLGYVRSTRASDLAVPLFLLLVGIVTFLVRVVPLSGVFVYSGRDITWYTLITERVSQDGHFTGWGGFAGAAWNIGVDPHLIFEGFHAITALFLLITPLGAPQIVSYTVLVFNAYVALAIYFLARTVSKSKMLGLGSALTIAFISPYPAFFLLWGGIAEITNWVIVPVAIGLLSETRSMRDPSAWVCVTLASGSIVIHPISSAYFFGFAFALILANLVWHRQARVTTLIGVTGSAVLLVVPFLVNAYRNVSAQAAGLPAGTFGWEGFQSKVLISPVDLSRSWWNVLTFTTGWTFAPAVVITGLLGAGLAWREKWPRYLLAWLAVLVLLNENGPFGLYLIPFPFWWALFPERFALAAFIPLSILSTKFILELSGKLPATLPYFSHLLRKRHIVLAAFVVISLVAVQNYAAVSTSISWANPVTSSDVTAFQWMQQNLPPNSTVLVNDADSGWWLPAFTGIRAFGVSPMITSPVARTDSDRLKYLIIAQPTCSETIQLLRKYGVTHIFFGDKTTYGLSRQDVRVLTAFKAISHYHVKYHTGNVFIFEVQLQ